MQIWFLKIDVPLFNNRTSFVILSLFFIKKCCFRNVYFCCLATEKLSTLLRNLCWWGHHHHTQKSYYGRSPNTRTYFLRRTLKRPPHCKTYFQSGQLLANKQLVISMTVREEFLGPSFSGPYLGNFCLWQCSLNPLGLIASQMRLSSKVWKIFYNKYLQFFLPQEELSLSASRFYSIHCDSACPQEFTIVRDLGTRIRTGDHCLNEPPHL